MFKVGDYIVYRKDVCVVKEIMKNFYGNKDYYRLGLINDSSLKIDVPVDSKFIRDIISEAEVNKIIDNIPMIEIVKNQDKYIENVYKELMISGRHEDLIKIIKTSYLRNKERLDNNKKVIDKDNNYFMQAEKYLYTEFSIALGISYEDAKNYVIERVKKIC